MENTIFFSTRHTFRLFILFLCSISISLHGMFTAPRRTPVRKPIALPSAIQQLEPEKSKERAQVLEQFKQEQLEAQRLEQERLKKERLDAEEKQKTLLQSHYPMMGLTIKGGMPSLKQERIQAVKKKHAGVIKIQGSDGSVVLFPEYIAKMSGKIKTRIEDLRRKSVFDQPIPAIPLSYSSFVIQDIRNIIGQRVHFPIEKAIEEKKYSLDQLIERFNFLHSLKFPSNIQDAFKDKIIAITKPMNFNEIIQNKNSIRKLDPNLLEFKPLLEIANSITIVDNEQNKIILPESIWKMSQTFSSMIGDLGGTIPEDPLPVACSLSVVQNIRDIIEQKHSIGDTIKAYPLNKLIEITNCLNHLGFPKEIQKPFEARIYLLCKQIPEPNLSYLNPDLVQLIFANPVIDKLEYQLFKKSLTQDDRKTVLSEGSRVAFSPNGKMLAIGKEKSVEIWTFSNDGICNLSQELLINIDFSKITFSSDNKKLAIGTFFAENDIILLYNIDDIRIHDEPRILVGHQSTVTQSTVSNIAFSPNGKIMVSASHNTDNVKAETLFLWTFNENGIVNKEPQVLASNLNIISPIHFTDDGKILIVSIDGRNLYLLTFDEKGISLKPSYIPVSFAPTFLGRHKFIFFSHNKKFVLHDGYTGNNNIYICDFNDHNNITIKKIFDGYNDTTLIDLINDTIIIIEVLDDPYRNKRRLLCIDISNSENTTHEEIPVPTKYFHYLYRSPDNKKVVLTNYEGSILCTTVTNEEEILLNTLKKLDPHKLLLIDKILDGNKNLPIEKYDIPKDIIGLLGKLDLISIPLPPKNPQLEKEKEDMRRYFAHPNLQPVEARTQAIQALKNIYQGIQKEAFEAVVDEMGLSHLL